MGNEKTYNWCLDYGTMNETAPKIYISLELCVFHEDKNPSE